MGIPALTNRHVLPLCTQYIKLNMAWKSLLLLGLFLSACGQKGPLYMEAPDQPVKKAKPVMVDPSSTVPKEESQVE